MNSVSDSNIGVGQVIILIHVFKNRFAEFVSLFRRRALAHSLQVLVAVFIQWLVTQLTQIITVDLPSTLDQPHTAFTTTSRQKVHYKCFSQIKVERLGGISVSLYST